MPRLLPDSDRNLRSSGFLRPVRFVEGHDDPALLPVTDHQIVQIEQTVRHDDFLLRFGIGFRGGGNHLSGRRSGKPLPAGPNRSIVPGSRRFVGLPFHRSILPRKTGRHRYRDRDSYRLRCRCRFRYRHGFRGRFVGKHRIRLGHRSRRNDKYRFRLRFCNGRCRNRLHGGRRFRHSSRHPGGFTQSFGHRSRLRQGVADRLRQQIVQVDTYFGHRRNFGDGLLRSDGRGSGGIPFVEIRKPYRFIQFFELVQNQIPLDAGDIVRTRPAIDQFDQTGKFFLYLVHLHNKIGLSEPKVRKISDAGNGLSADCQKFTDAARRLFSESEKLCISLLRMQNRTKNLRTDTAPALLHIPTLKKSS